jgi:hypothetical protein
MADSDVDMDEENGTVNPPAEGSTTRRTRNAGAAVPGKSGVRKIGKKGTTKPGARAANAGRITGDLSSIDQEPTAAQPTVPSFDSDAMLAAALSELDVTTNHKSDDVLIPRKDAGANSFTYNTRADIEAKNEKRPKEAAILLKDSVLLMKGEDGVHRTPTQVYYSVKIPKGTPHNQWKDVRNAYLASELSRVGLKSSHVNICFQGKKLADNDSRATFSTPDGMQERSHAYFLPKGHTEKANHHFSGEHLPNLRITVPVKAGTAVKGLWCTDERLKALTFEQILEKYPDMTIKSRNNIFSKPAEIDSVYGKGAAKQRFQAYRGDTPYANKNLPEVTIKGTNQDRYFSQAMVETKGNSILNDALKGDAKVFTKVHALVLNKTHTGYSSPSFQNFGKLPYYPELAKRNNLPEGFEMIGKNTKNTKMDPVMVYHRGVLLGNEDPDVKDHRGDLITVFGAKNTFLASYDETGLPTGSLTRVDYARDNGKTITREQAEIAGGGIQSHISQEDLKKLTKYRAANERRNATLGAESDGGGSDNENPGRSGNFTNTRNSERDDRSRSSNHGAGL